MGNTRIDWARKAWNVVTGCTEISPGCDNCYAERLAMTRLRDKRRYAGVADSNGWTGRIRCHSDLLSEPSRWRYHQRVFVAPQADLFHRLVPTSFIDDVFQRIIECPRHTYLVLTKRAKRMRDYMKGCERGADDAGVRFPWPHVHLGVTVEDGFRRDRLCDLVETPAAVRWVSIEPMLGPINMSPWLKYLDWVVLGCESGPKRRPCELEWIMNVTRQCREVNVPVFVKQINVGGQVLKRKGDDWPQNWPDALKVQEYPHGSPRR